MKLFNEVLFPRFYDRVMGSAAIDEARREYLSTVSGKVLEIGFGTGQNLPHYPEAVTELTAIDPNPGMHKVARRRLEDSPLRVDLRRFAGESLPFADGEFDSVVCAYTLCSIDGIERALDEIHRILKPGGHFHFLEHGHSPDPSVDRWQRRLEPLQKRFAGGCRLTRNIRALVQARFGEVEVREYYMAGDPRTHGYTYQGKARKSQVGN